MNPLLKDRVKLIRAMMEAENNLICDGYLQNHTKGILQKNIIEAIRANKLNQFVSLSQDDNTKISYATKPEKLQETDKAHKNRTKTSLGRYVRKQLEVKGTDINDNILNKFVEYTIMHSTSAKDIEKQIKLLSGSEISNFYTSSGIHSCMTGNKYFTELYDLNPDKVQLVVYNNQTRALLWTCDDGTKVLDRFYPSGHKFYHLLLKWAKANNIVYKKFNNGDVGANVLSDNQVHKITLKYDHTFPYMDTFAFGQFVDGNEIVVENHILNNHNKYASLRRTDGFFENHYNDYTAPCYCCKQLKPDSKLRSEIYFNELNADRRLSEFCAYICKSCFDQYYIYCPKCSTITHEAQIYKKHCNCCMPADIRNEFVLLNNKSIQTQSSNNSLIPTPQPQIIAPI